MVRLILKAEQDKDPSDDSEDEADGREDDGDTGEEGPNEDLEPVDAAAGYSPRVVKTPMHQNADVNHETAKKIEAANPTPKKQETSVKKSKPHVDRIYKDLTMHGGHQMMPGVGGTTTPAPSAPAPIHSSPTAPKPDVNAQADNAPPTNAQGSPYQVTHAAMTMAANAPKPGSAPSYDIDKAMPSVTLMKAAKTGPGSRDGKIVRHTKTGAPVYESQAKKQAERSDQMMQNWHNHAQRSNDPEHHAVASKQALHAAYFHHHAGDEAASSQAMDYANHHRAQYEKVNHKSRTTTAIEKMHDTTAHEVGHGGWDPMAHGLSEDHMVSEDARREGNKKKADAVRPREDRSGHVIGTTRTGKPIHGPSKKLIDEQNLYTAARNKSPGGIADDKAYDRYEHAMHHHIRSTSEGYTADDHQDAANAHNKADNALDTMVHMGLANRHAGARDHKRGLSTTKHSNPYHPDHDKTKKALSPSNSIGGNMTTKNEVADLFKSELGVNDEAPITKCIHCEHDLSKSDLKKGLGTSFVADDNDNPHDGPVPGQIEPSRPGAGVSENDVIAPLLKSCKGATAGDSEEFPISKSEMSEMGMNTSDLEDGWYKISKSELKRVGCENYVDYLADRKASVQKSMTPTVKKGVTEDIDPIAPEARVEKSIPRGYTPRAGGVHGAKGEQLVQWSQGTDAEVAKFIEQNGGYGPGHDELVKTGQRH